MWWYLLILFIIITIIIIAIVNNKKAVYQYCYHYFKYCRFTNNNNRRNKLIFLPGIHIFIKVVIFGGLIDFTRQENLDLKNILMTSLREGRKFIDLFLCQKSSHLISVMFSERENQTLKLLSKLQKSTRQLQALCTHGKLRRYVRI